MIDNVSFSNKDYNKLISLVMKIPTSPSIKKFENISASKIRTPHHLSESNSGQDTFTSYSMNAGFGGCPLKKKQIVANNMNYASKKEYFNLNMMKNLIKSKGIVDEIFHDIPSKKGNNSNKFDSQINFETNKKHHYLSPGIITTKTTFTPAVTTSISKRNLISSFDEDNVSPNNKVKGIQVKINQQLIESTSKTDKMDKLNSNKLSDIEFQLSREVSRVDNNLNALKSNRNNSGPFSKTNFSPLSSSGMGNKISYNLSPTNNKSSPMPFKVNTSNKKINIIKVHKNDLSSKAKSPTSNGKPSNTLKA